MMAHAVTKTSKEPIGWQGNYPDSKPVASGQLTWFSQECADLSALFPAGDLSLAKSDDMSSHSKTCRFELLLCSLLRSLNVVAPK